MPKAKNGKDYIAFVWGTPEDKEKLLVLAEGGSSSDYLRRLIDDLYYEKYGTTPASALLPNKAK